MWNTTCQLPTWETFSHCTVASKRQLHGCSCSSGFCKSSDSVMKLLCALFQEGGKKTVQKKIKWKVIVLLKELFNLQQYWPRTHLVRRLHRTWIPNFWRYNWPARSFQSVKPMLEVDMHLLPIVSEGCSASSLVHHLMEKFPERWKLYTAAY